MTWQPPADGRLRVFVHEFDQADPAPIVQAAVDVLKDHGAVLARDVEEADLAIAPLLSKKLGPEILYASALGTLIFHPSLLPRHRGRDAIRWTFRLKEPYAGATWFWADENLDTGDICESEVLAIRDGERPREFYERAVMPSALRMLGYILDDLSRGFVRRRPQNEESATYEEPIPRS